MPERALHARPRRRGRLVPLAACVLAALAGLAAVSLWRPDAGDGQQPVAPIVAQPDSSVPSLVLIGSSPQEEAGGTWGVTPVGDAVFRRRASGAWERLPAPVAADGGPLGTVAFAATTSGGRVTPRGGLALAGSAAPAGETDARATLFVRDPGGGLRAAPAPVQNRATAPDVTPGAVLFDGETLFGAGDGAGRAVLAVVEEPGGRTGAFTPPATLPGRIANGILHFDGERWTREAICLDAATPPACPTLRSGFAVVALEATSPGNAWALVRTGLEADGVVLLHRDASGPEPVWRRADLGATPFAERSPAVSPEVAVTIAPRTAGQPLTVTEAGAWVDAQVAVAGASRPLDATLFARFDGPGRATVAGRWCDPPAAVAALCDRPLGVGLPTGAGRSFAWAEGGPFGARVVTGLPNGVMLTLSGEQLVRVPTVGGDAGAVYGAAFAAPDDGWLGPNVQVSRAAAPDRVQPWPVPFRRPLTAIAAEPGGTPGDLGASALVVGDRGQVARYRPGRGWDPEFLLSDSGARATPRLRGVAWPTADRAHAVGDDAEMWVWRRQTGLWEPDPAKPPNLVLVNFTGIAFDPADAERGYAIGKQGLLLRYGRQWTPEGLPAGVDPRANLTSIAFAGRQAMATWRLPVASGGSTTQTGGLIVDDGAGWRVDESLAAALPDGPAGVPERVAGLPDGGAVVATAGGWVATRDGVGGPWRAAPGGGFGAPVALAAIREAGQVRAVVSSGRVVDAAVDDEQVVNPPGEDQAPLVTAPYALPVGGTLLRQTESGWRDERRLDFPRSGRDGGTVDQPLRPDAVLAMLLSPDGARGWAVGGETGQDATFRQDGVQTAAIMRYPAEGAPPAGATSATLSAGDGVAAFAIGGNAACVGACADLSNVFAGPDVWLPAAVRNASRIGGVRAFLHTGPGVAPGLATRLSGADYAREQLTHAQRLATAAGPLPVFAAPSAPDRDAAGTLDAFRAAFAGFSAPLGAGPPAPGITPAATDPAAGGAYAFDSAGQGGTVRVIVLDMSGPVVGEEQRCWLARRLAEAGARGAPAIVVGQRDLTAAQGAGNATADGAALIPTLVLGAAPDGCALSGRPAGASAYFFDYPEQNRTYAVSAGGRSIPTFGSGTLGYVGLRDPNLTDPVDASGFLLAAVDVARRDPATNVAPVTARLIPSIAELALDAQDGTLLRRSQVALFRALARRPRAGMRCDGAAGSGCEVYAPDPYVAIPADCQGARCASGLQPEYRFTSSRPDVASFVRQDPSSPNPRTVFLDEGSRPVADPASGLLCAFNAGTTTVTIETGGLAYSQTITVQPGSVRRPCGTVPLADPPRAPEARPVEPPPFRPEPPPRERPDPPLRELPPPPPPPTEPVAVAPPARAPAPRTLPRAPPPAQPRVQLPEPFVSRDPGSLTQIRAAVPPPAPTAARPIPPTGAAPVPIANPAVSPQREREEEEAIEQAHNAAAYREDPLRTARALPALVLLLAIGGGVAAGTRRRRDVAWARTTTPSTRPRRFRR